MLVEEPRSEALRERYGEDPHLIVWWATEIECVSAISRFEREDDLTRAGTARSFALLDSFTTRWQEIEPSEPLRRTAKRLLRVHPLRAADALQVAAATIAAEGNPETLELVSLDRRFTEAARLEGFSVLGA